MTGWLHDLIETAPADGCALIDHDGRRFIYGELRAMTGALQKDAET